MTQSIAVTTAITNLNEAHHWYHSPRAFGAVGSAL